MNEETPRPRRRRWPWIVGGTVVLLLVAALFAVTLIDVEAFRGPLEKALTRATGWQVELGEMELSLLRGLALDVSPVTLAAPDGTSRAEVATVSVRGALLPLLRGKLEIHHVGLLQPKIVLVRPDEARGFVLPAFARAGNAGEGAEGGGGRGVDVSIDTIGIDGGALTLDDRVAGSPLGLQLDEVGMGYAIAGGTVTASGKFDTGGRLAVRGSAADGFAFSLEGVRSERLQPFVGKQLLHAGGLLDGEVTIGPGLAVSGTLRGRGLTLLAGRQPLAAPVSLDFGVRPEAGEWRLTRFELDAGGMAVSGGGTLVPLKMALTVAETPLATALTVSESVLPLPLELEAPGSLAATLAVRGAPGGAKVKAEGTLSAARYVVAPELPPVDDVKTRFALRESGELSVEVLQGRVAGGAVSGGARLDSFDPPGRLTLDGDIREAVLGQLLGAFVSDAAKKVQGAAGVDAALGIDLSQPFSLRALRGGIELNSRQATLPGWDLEGALRRELEAKLDKLGDLRQLLKIKESKPTQAGEIVSELFDSLDAKIDLDVWPWKLERLRLAAGGFGASGQGSFDPETGKVDLKLAAAIDAARSAQLVGKEPRLRALLDGEGRIVVPMTVRGSLLRPAVGVELGALVRQNKDGLRDKLLKKLTDR